MSFHIPVNNFSPSQYFYTKLQILRDINMYQLIPKYDTKSQPATYSNYQIHDVAPDLEKISDLTITTWLTLLQITFHPGNTR